MCDKTEILEEGSPMICSSPSTFPWTTMDDEIKSESNDIQMYRKKISDLENKLQEAHREIESLRSQLTKGTKTESPKSQSRYWTDEEHGLFLEALSLYGPKDVKSIAAHVGTRNSTQDRERKKEDERKRQEGQFGHDQFEQFLIAVKGTTQEPDIDKKASLIQQCYMPNISKETIKAWLFVHTKTVEKIQSSEAHMAANSVGVKRIRANSNPPSIMSIHRNSQSNRMQVVSNPTTALAQSQISSQMFSNTPQYFPQTNMYQNEMQFQNFEPHFSRFDRPRPNSEPNFSPNFAQQSFCFDQPSPKHNHNIHSPNHSIIPDIKPYVPGAPPPTNPAPPPPLFNTFQ